MFRTFFFLKIIIRKAHIMCVIKYQMLYDNSSLHVTDPYLVATFIAHNIIGGISLIKPG